jgi:DNA-binding transcriptional ArsR family regulator
MANQTQLDRTFAACAHPIRRGIIERLGTREMTVGEATGDFAVSKPSISKHLRVLEEAGAIVRVIDGRTHRLRLSEHGLDDAQEWMSDQRAIWERKFDVLEDYLAEQRTRSARRASDSASDGSDAGRPPPPPPRCAWSAPSRPHPRRSSTLGPAPRC